MIDDAYKPRISAKHYGATECLTKAEFDELVDSGFRDGPFRESFGDGDGEPYYPWRQAFGTLKDGRKVFCELHKDLRDRKANSHD